MTNDNGLPYRVGDPVRITNPALPESGVCGEVCDYDPEAQWYVVDLDAGPPWRGRYEAGELEREKCPTKNRRRCFCRTGCENA